MNVLAVLTWQETYRLRFKKIELVLKMKDILFKRRKNECIVWELITNL